MNVLFAVSECVPFVKTGGLADVAGSLPKDLAKLGTNVCVMMPKYGQIPQKYKDEMSLTKIVDVQVGWRKQYCGLEVMQMDGVTYVFLDNEYYFNRDTLYGHYDDGERFSFFCRAVIESIPFLDFTPDVIHCHDWHTGMIPFLLRAHYEQYDVIQTVFTIHNLQFQGIFPKEILHDLLNLNDYYFTENQLEFYGNVNFMKAAIVSADKITTVSPTYRDEIQVPYYGEKLDGLLRKRQPDLLGIINGIDDTMYNPQVDKLIPYPYSAVNLKNKARNKTYIQRELGLKEDKQVPIISMVTRLTAQKGLELVRHVFHEMMALDVQLVVLGTGDKEFESFFIDMEAQYPGKVKTVIGFDEELAHLIYAGSDLFLMPSKFEPCGLGQLIALKYGAVPIIRETGGLNDTVQSYDEESGEGNGFSFTNFNAHDMLHTIKRAREFYARTDVWAQLVVNGMSQDYSWAQSAFKYNQLYASLLLKE
ncbi:glycogen synthase GlgA [Bacillus sp. CGMCC 1.16541]|uniref:glycogen synthase GlgA n=1 Tax=Bacillus sp. CGMCC 1.16541 TaxID=2185143 RepID=UPI000D726A00|nr:glycogen synthase GlgA [Bacillus sp. CGMCC 1.16541]